MRQEFEVIKERSVRVSERGWSVREVRFARLVALGRALSDPIRACAKMDGC